MMDLRTFVKTALIDIVSGVRDAQAELAPGSVVPFQLTEAVYVRRGVAPSQMAQFEVYVRDEDSHSSEGGLRVVCEGSVSVIRFNVPIQLPASEPPSKDQKQ